MVATVTRNGVVIPAYKTTVDWSAMFGLESESYTSTTRYDALNRPIQLVAPHSNQPNTKINITQPSYNEANLLERINVWLEQSHEPDILLDPATANLHAVTGIDYDAKGQRLQIDYGNGASTEYQYDPLTFRLTHLLTRRNASDFPDDCPQSTPTGWPGCQIQNLHYSYDPVGNITHIHDDAQQTIFFRNKRVEPSNDYLYDAVYRLIEATGREHLGQGGAPVPHSHSDVSRVGLLHPGDGNAMGNYLERYVYDAVGNFLEMQHRGSNPSHSGWNRGYTYNETSLLDPAKQSNRLSSTAVGNGNTITENYSYDAHGNMTSMPHLSLMQWDYRDQLQATARQLVNGGTPETTWYVYDSNGQRVRKVTEEQAIADEKPLRKNERIYLNGFEIYRQYESDGELVKLERESLHVMDDHQRIALVETRTRGNDPSLRQLIRYQFGNHLGSVNLELDDDARVVSYEEYTPYGSTVYQVNIPGTEVPKRYRYTGKERDNENGFYYHGARYYLPWTGTWLNIDPSFLVDGSNLYRYLSSKNPILHIDDTGRKTTNKPGAGLVSGSSKAKLNYTSRASLHKLKTIPFDDFLEDIFYDDRSSSVVRSEKALVVNKEKQQELRAIAKGTQINLDNIGAGSKSDPLKHIASYKDHDDCGAACTKGLNASGYRIRGEGRNGLLTSFQLFKKGDVSGDSEKLTMLNEDQGRLLLDKLDENLFQGRPVAVGIDTHAGDGAGGKGKPDEITDHWAYIIARSYDDEGRVFYVLAENANSGKDEDQDFKYKQLQKLYVDPKTFTLVKPELSKEEGDPTRDDYVNQKYTIVNLREVTPIKK